MLNKYLLYFKDNPKNYWFRAKYFGWGWTPVKWQGWLVLGGYLGVVFLIVTELTNKGYSGNPPVIFLLPILALTALLILICYITGEKPVRRWGPFEKKSK